MEYLATQSQSPPKTPRVAVVPSAEELYSLVKQRIFTKLQEQAYMSDEGVWIDPVPAKDLGTLTSVILKMLQEERKVELEQNGGSRIVPIPSFPQVVVK